MEQVKILRYYFNEGAEFDCVELNELIQGECVNYWEVVQITPMSERCIFVTLERPYEYADLPYYTEEEDIELDEDFIEYIDDDYEEEEECTKG